MRIKKMTSALVPVVVELEPKDVLKAFDFVVPTAHQ